MSLSTVTCDVLIIGGGVIGAAAAYEIVQKGYNCVLVDTERYFGAHTSSRNSEVIHAGLYYQNKPLKNKHCLRGRSLLYQYLDRHNIKYKKCGKIIFAVDFDDHDNLNQIFQNGIQNNVELNYLTSTQLNELPPFVKPTEAIFSSQTGIFDSTEYLKSLLYNFEEKGGLAVTSTQVMTIHDDNGLEVICKSPVDRFTIKCRQIINTAGAKSLDIIKSLYPEKYKAYNNFYVKGHYFTLKQKLKADKLYYPIPSKFGLGVHLTIDLLGDIKFGPDTVPTPISDDYSAATSKLKMQREINNNFQDINFDDLYYSYSGVRPKIKHNNALCDDFLICSDHNNKIISLLGIESPGLTSSLSIAQDISKYVII